MYAIYRDTNGGRDLLVDMVNLAELPELLHRLRAEFPCCYAVKVA